MRWGGPQERGAASPPHPRPRVLSARCVCAAGLCPQSAPAPAAPAGQGGKRSGSVVPQTFVRPERGLAPPALSAFLRICHGCLEQRRVPVAPFQWLRRSCPGMGRALRGVGAVPSRFPCAGSGGTAAGAARSGVTGPARLPGCVHAAFVSVALLLSVHQQPTFHNLLPVVIFRFENWACWGVSRRRVAENQRELAATPGCGGAGMLGPAAAAAAGRQAACPARGGLIWSSVLMQRYIVCYFSSRVSGAHVNRCSGLPLKRGHI